MTILNLRKENINLQIEMVRGPNWKPLKVLRGEVRLFKRLYLKYVSKMSRRECEKFIAYFGSVHNARAVANIIQPEPDGKLVEYSSGDSEDYDD
jgi:predicted NAD/FAD-binding protein